jgi:hypothetical protein
LTNENTTPGVRKIQTALLAIEQDIPEVTDADNIKWILDNYEVDIPEIVNAASVIQNFINHYKALEEKEAEEEAGE